MTNPEHENLQQPSQEGLMRADGGAGFNGDDEQRLQRIGLWAAGRFTDGNEKMPFVATQEVRDYVNSWGDQKRERIATIFQTMTGPVVPMAATAHPNIPVAAGQEAIQRPLEQFARQDADPQTWGGLLLVNQVSGYDMTKEIRETLRVIDNFHNRHDGVNIRACYTTYDTPPKMGSVRADGWDVLLYELVQWVRRSMIMLLVYRGMPIRTLSPQIIYLHCNKQPKTTLWQIYLLPTLAGTG